MARYNPHRDAAPIIDAAQQWIRTCLIEQGSLFGDAALWTPSVIDEVRIAFVENPDAGSASFYEKLEGQLQNASREAKRLMAELLWVLMLFQSNIGPEKKRESVRRVWAWSGAELEASHPLLADACLIGIGSPGTAYNTMRWRELGYLIGMAADLQGRSHDERAAIFSDRERFEDWISKAPEDGRRQFRHILRYFAFPDHHERITQNRDRKAILEAFGEVGSKQAKNLSDREQDDALLTLRRKLEAELGTSELDFYTPPLSERWRTPKASSTRADESSSLELGYAELRERFLVHFPHFGPIPSGLGYDNRERLYKDELVHLFEQTVSPLLAQADWPAAGAAAIELLTRPLRHASSRPQNIVGWRYVDLLRNLGDVQRAEFARALNDLLDDDQPIEARVDRFVDLLGRLAGDGKPVLAAAQRSITGFYLALSEPRQHLFLKTQELQRALRSLDPTFHWTPKRLAGADVKRVEDLAAWVFNRLKADGWNPKDMLDVQGFLWVAEGYRDTVTEADAEEAEEEDTMATAPSEFGMPPLNQILFGPPGTGKTFQSINKALEVLDRAFLNQHLSDRAVLKRRYDDLAREGLIQFVTFHQSFSYEDFVEGLRAETDEDTGQLRYEIVDGVFKQLCDSARTRVVRESRDTLDPAGRRIWKLSLGNSSTEGYIFDECIEKGMALIGFGGGADFSQCATREDVQRTFASVGEQLALSDYPVTAINTFVRQVKKGDLVVVTEGNLKFRALGEFTGDYRLIPRDNGDTFAQCRDVRWLRVYSPGLPYDQLMDNRFSQMTIYELRSGSIDLNKLKALLQTEDDTTGSTKPRVLIIDEINRGNVSRILGELITLIEPTKRAGAEEALEVVLPYSKQRFSVPDNVYLIGTMNTADRSLAGLDIALRRRFQFVEMPPRPELLKDITVAGVNVEAMLKAMNQRIVALLDRDHRLGHAYFLSLKDGDGLPVLATLFRNQILPLLQEYFFEDWQRIAWVLNDHRKPKGCRFVVLPDFNTESLFGNGAEVPMDAKLWCLDEGAFYRPESYLGIIAASQG